MTIETHNEALLLKIKNLVALSEFETSCANRELHHFGDWQSDHQKAIQQYQREIEAITAGLIP